MNWSYSYRPDIWPAVITLALLIYLGWYSWSRRYIPSAKPFGIACFLGGLWTLGAILELSAANFPAKVFWVKFQAIWQLPAASVITCFVLRYAGLGRWLTRRNCVLLSLVPVLCVLLMVTNGSHNLIWTGFQMNGNVTVSSGRLFWVFIGYGILLGIFNFVVLVWLAIFSPAHRLPVAIMVASQMIGHVGYTIDKLGTDLFAPGEAVFFVVGVVCSGYAVAFLRFHAIDPVAAARDAALQQMREGLIVLDLQGRIADVNPMAAAMMGVSEDSLRDKTIEEALPVNLSELGQLTNKGIGQADITLGKGNLARQYTLNSTALEGRKGEVIGQLLLLHDVTEQRRAQARILEQQRAVATLQERARLARELHDGIGQVLGYLGMQTQTALKWLHDGNNEKADALFRRLAGVAKDAHADVRESILALKTGSGQQWSFIPAVKEYVEKFQLNYGIRTELALSEGIDENTFDSGTGVHLLRAIQEALTNARKHSGANKLKVRLDLDGGKARITIADDGHGFDVSQSTRGDSGHFGLVFMGERMEQIGGSMEIESTAGGGTVLKLAVPTATYREETK